MIGAPLHLRFIFLAARCATAEGRAGASPLSRRAAARRAMRIKFVVSAACSALGLLMQT